MKERSFAREGYLRENYRLFHLRDTAGQERDFHFHDFDKLVVLLSGRVDYTVENETWHLRPWDVLLVKHHTIHRALIDRNVPYERIILYLDGRYLDRMMPEAELSGCFEQSERHGRHLFTPDEQQRGRLQTCLEELEEAMGDERFGAAALRDACLIRLMVEVNRLVRKNAPLPVQEQTVYDPKIARALSYINENLCRDISVEEIAEHAYLSKYYFMRLFKAQTGASVHAYVRQKRLMNAVRLIREGVGVSRAATESGFGDYSSFYRAFRETFGVSPGELK